MKNKLVNFLIIISSAVFITSSVLLIIKYINIKKVEEEATLIENISKKLNFENDENGEKEIAAFRTEFNNNDIVGILNISDIISVPVAQTNNNKYYLKYALNKKRKPGGAVFIDYRTNINDRQINIYGHNSTKYDIPFKKLESYLDNTFTTNNQVITFKTMDEIRIYQIFSVSFSARTDKTEHYYFEYVTDNDWKEHFDRLKKSSFYISNIELTDSDEIIILQTCLFKKYKGKFLVIAAKRIK